MTRSLQETDYAFGILVVCNANRARSIIAQCLIQQVIDQFDLPWTVDSAGTNALAGEPPADGAVIALKGLGIDATALRAKPISGALIHQAQLIVTAEVEQRRHVVAADVGALEKVFTLRQFARYAATIELRTACRASLGPDLLAGARIARSRSQPVPASDDEIPDPTGRRAHKFRASYEMVAHAVDAIAGAIANAPAVKTSADGGATARDRHLRGVSQAQRASQ